MTTSAVRPKPQLRSNLRRKWTPAEIDRQRSASVPPQENRCFSGGYANAGIRSAEISADPPYLRMTGALSKKSPRSPQGSNATSKGASKGTGLALYQSPGSVLSLGQGSILGAPSARVRLLPRTADSVRHPAAFRRAWDRLPTAAAPHMTTALQARRVDASARPRRRTPDWSSSVTLAGPTPLEPERNHHA